MSLSSSPPDDKLSVRLLAALRADRGKPVSGRAIGEMLDISRAAVWKRVEALRKSGYLIESIPRRGYLLQDEPDTPTASAIARGLDAETRRHGLFSQEKIHFFSSVDSSNDKAAAMARSTAPDGTVVVADHQSMGRGRLGRVWDSPGGVNLYFSLILKPEIEPRYASQLTLLTGLALAEAIGVTGVAGVQIKWPNDILLTGRKVAGILTEMAVEENRVQHVIVGVGVNVNSSVADLAPELATIAVTIADQLKKKVKRSALMADFLNRFGVWYRRYLDSGFAAIRPVWLEMSGILGQRVRINLAKESFTGRAVDLDADGFLLVKRDKDGTQARVLAGDVLLLG